MAAKTAKFTVTEYRGEFVLKKEKSGKFLRMDGKSTPFLDDGIATFNTEDAADLAAQMLSQNQEKLVLGLAAGLAAGMEKPRNKPYRELLAHAGLTYGRKEQ